MIIDPFAKKDLQPNLSLVDLPKLNEALDHFLDGDAETGAVDSGKDLLRYGIQRGENDVGLEEIISHLLQP
jgi:hypothetical protein